MADAMAAVAEPLDPLDGPRTMWPGTERMLPFSSAATVLCATVVLLRTHPSRTKEERTNTVDAAVAERYNALLSRVRVWILILGTFGQITFWKSTRPVFGMTDMQAPLAIVLTFVMSHVLTRSVDPARRDAFFRALLISGILSIRVCRSLDLITAEDSAAFVRSAAAALETTYDVASTWFCFAMGGVIGVLQPMEPAAWRIVFIGFLTFSSLIPPAMAYALCGQSAWLRAAAQVLLLPTLLGLLLESLVRGLIQRVLASIVRNEQAMALPGDAPLASAVAATGTTSAAAAGSTTTSNPSTSPMSAPVCSLDALETVGVLGFGSSAQVRLVRERATGELRALKSVFKARNGRRLREDTYRRIKEEAAILQLVHQHAFIVRLHGSFEDASCVHLVLQYASNGTLSQWLNEPCDEVSARLLSAEIAAALAHLHTHSIVYRDLKPDNVLVNGDGHVMLADFGVSKRITSSTRQARRSLVGTEGYIAPEIVQCGGAGGMSDSRLEGDADGYSFSVDWWSFGVLLHVLLTGEEVIGIATIYEALAAPPELRDRFAAERLESGPPGSMSNEARELILGLLVFEPTERLGTAGGARDVKAHAFFTPIDWQLLEQLALPPPLPKLKGPNINLELQHPGAARPAAAAGATAPTAAAAADVPRASSQKPKRATRSPAPSRSL